MPRTAELLRIERIADIEGMGRLANEFVASAFADQPPTTATFRCECANDVCPQSLSIPVSVYDGVRHDPMLFLVAPGHYVPDAEFVQERGDGFWVIRKNEQARPLVEATDPRSGDVAIPLDSGAPDQRALIFACDTCGAPVDAAGPCRVCGRGTAAGKYI